MERTCIFVISDCLPFSRQIDFYISCYWKLSGLDCQACLALGSAAKPVSGLYDLALGRTFKAFNSQVISMIQYCFCLNHLCCCSFSPRPDSCFLSFLFSFLPFFFFSSLIPNSFFFSFLYWLRVCASKTVAFSCPYLFVEREDLLHHDRLEIKQKR